MDNQPAQAPNYPPVKITNLTDHLVAGGEVRYAVCKDDNYTDLPAKGGNWTGPYRGACLVTKITALVRPPSGDVWADPYESSGTSYSNFAVIQIGSQFKVTRITEGSEEPTTEQK